jgi:hypothetical protein
MAYDICKEVTDMNHEKLLISERIDEVKMMCDREHPIYEQISCFSIALYVIGYFNCADLMSFDDVDTTEAGCILKEDFTEITEEELPSEYNILESPDKYLFVFGDPIFPEHFAVLTDTRSEKPFFSKLRFFGSGFDSLEELKSEYLGKDGVGYNDLHYFKKKRSDAFNSSSFGKIYTIKDDGSCSVYRNETSK